MTGDISWQTRANCRGLDPGLFFPDRGESITEARRVCAGCVVREQCLDYAMARTSLIGIWGGTSERQRKQLRARRKRGAA